ncbi:hypothetical protein HLB23_24285 [Nocardia uniformis]|uniref:Uncharacterized protein n=1 Tax=Nocardia uniformis TaxID=53432 RepID=A0A849C993_9NOCA|nr:hypothetical protein [Nocardia uniformis]NNH72940.1 hypothetical protein [Nocardia uniformis]
MNEAVYRRPVGWFNRSTQHQDAQAAAEWSRFWEYANWNNLQILSVDIVYHFARQGTKALVRLHNTEYLRDAWFWGLHVQPQSVVAVQASVGWGPHTNRHDVLYIGDRYAPGVYAVVAPATVAAARRHLSG